MKYMLYILFNPQAHKISIQALYVHLDCFGQLYVKLELIHCLNFSYILVVILYPHFQLHILPIYAYVKYNFNIIK